MDISSSMVEFSGGNPSKMTLGFLAKPKNTGKYPAVIVIQEIWGVVDHIKNVCRRLANEGYVALAVDLFGGKMVSSLEQGCKLRGELSEERIMNDLKGGFHYLQTLQNVNPKKLEASASAWEVDFLFC